MASTLSVHRKRNAARLRVIHGYVSASATLLSLQSVVEGLSPSSVDCVATHIACHGLEWCNEYKITSYGRLVAMIRWSVAVCWSSLLADAS